MQKRYENRKFVFNEIFSISTSANKGSYPYAYFVDLTETAMNKGALGTFQGKASIAEGKIIDAIKEYRKTKDIKHYNEAVRVKNVFNNDTRRLFLSGEKVLKYEKEFGIKPNALKLELGTAKQIKDRINFASDYYTTKNLKKWKDLGIDIDTHTGRSGYVKTFGEKYFVPKNVAVASELFTKETRFGKGKKIFDIKALENFIKNNKTLTEAIKVAKTTKGPPRVKALQTLVSLGIGTALFTHLGIDITSAEAKTLETSDKTQEAGISATDVSKGALATGAGYAITHPKQAWELAKKTVLKPLDKIIAPFLTPAISIATHGKPDVTSGLEWITPAFWNAMTKRFGLTGTIEAFKKAPNAAAKSKIAIEMLLRAGIPMKALPIISGAASTVAGPLLVSDAAKALQKIIDEQGLTGKIEEQSFIGDEAGAGYLMSEAHDKKRREDVKGMDYARGGIASLLKW
jgi:hypothetical protein